LPIHVELVPLLVKPFVRLAEDDLVPSRLFLAPCAVHRGSISRRSDGETLATHGGGRYLCPAMLLFG
jgi:hypothetical protein